MFRAGATLCESECAHTHEHIHILPEDREGFHIKQYMHSGEELVTSKGVQPDPFHWKIILWK